MLDWVKKIYKDIIKQEIKFADDNDKLDLIFYHIRTKIENYVLKIV